MNPIERVLAHLEPEEVCPADEDAADSLAELRGRWPHPIPAGQLACLERFDFYNGALVADGEVVEHQYRIFDVATVLDELDYFVHDLEWPDPVLPLSGQDAWRECLTPDGRWITVDMGGGDVVHEWAARDLDAFLDERVDWLRSDGRGGRASGGRPASIQDRGQAMGHPEGGEPLQGCPPRPTDLGDRQPAASARPTTSNR